MEHLLFKIEHFKIEMTTIFSEKIVKEKAFFLTCYGRVIYEHRILIITII